MKDDRLLQLGQKIRYERVKRGLSQEDLEEKSSVSRRTISEIERGERKPTLETRYRYPLY